MRATKSEQVMATCKDGDELTVSVIVPTYNRRERLARLLASLEEAQTAGTRFEVVVTVDGSVDGTTEMLAAQRTSYPLTVLTQPNSGPGAARNRAIAAATGDVLVFLDDDVVPVVGLIERCLEIHRRDPCAVVIGPMIAPPGQRMAPWLRWEAMTLQKQYNAMLAGEYDPTPRQFYTANASVRREHALAVGGFDECFTRAEDVEFAYRLRDHGLRFYFDPTLVVLHKPDRSFAGWMRVPYQYGRFDVLMAQGRGRPYVLHTAFREWRRRPALNRVVLRWCVGHQWRLRPATALMALVLKYGRLAAPSRVQMVLCSALSNLQYWQGIADATGLGADVWRGLGDPSSVTSVETAAVVVPHAPR